MKKKLKTLFLIVLVFAFTSCRSVRVVSDYDKNTSFDNYNTFAFFKTGIDKAEISDLDKRRILREIEKELLAKGLTKSEDPDLLVSIFTKSRENINVFNNNGFGPYGYGWGWTPFYWNNFGSSISRTTEGSLYIDLIDAQKKELIWQGKGAGYLVTRNMEKKEERIKEFVSHIMQKYPPGIKEKL